MITVKRDIELELTPYELAEELWDKSDEEQAIFFSELGRLVDEAQGRGMMQLNYIIMSNKLDDKGKWIIKSIADALLE